MGANAQDSSLGRIPSSHSKMSARQICSEAAAMLLLSSAAAGMSFAACCQCWRALSLDGKAARLVAEQQQRLRLRDRGGILSTGGARGYPLPAYPPDRFIRVVARISGTGCRRRTCAAFHAADPSQRCRRGLAAPLVRESVPRC